jgi:dipeptidase D
MGVIMKKFTFILSLVGTFLIFLTFNLRAQTGMGTSNILEGYPPESVWNYFNEITKIPRCSGEEDQIREWLVETAKNAGLNVVVDDYGNVKIEKEASPGYESHEGVVLQAHLDMVCSPQNMTFPLELKITDGWLSANNTTLGADNGIGIAYAMAVLTDDNVVHPQLEVLFTVEEETGLTGANNLKEDFIKNRKLINLDSEDEETITIGCAGGGRSNITMPLVREAAGANMLPFVVSVNGLQGGHSGIDIDSRANPNKLIAEFLNEAENIAPELRIISIKSGEFDNAIPRNSEVWVVIDNNNRSKLFSLKDSMLTKWKSQFSDLEPNINIDIYETTYSIDPITKEITNNIINMINELPYGVIAWSKELEGVLETSVNISPVKTFTSSFVLTMMSRSIKLEEREKLRSQITEIANKYGAKCVNDNGYPPWEPNFDSQLLAFARNIYINHFGKEPAVEVTHGGLETAIIGSTYPGMDMISIGPTSENGHSPKERMNIQSVANVYSYLLELLQAL